MTRKRQDYIQTSSICSSDHTPMKTTPGDYNAQLGAFLAELCEPTPIDPNRAIFAQKTVASAPSQSSFPVNCLERMTSAMTPSSACYTRQMASSNTSSISEDSDISFNLSSNWPMNSQVRTSQVPGPSFEVTIPSPPPRDPSIRSCHVEQWNQRYRELEAFREEFQHCLVPLLWPRNPSLAHWVKRQRHQYRMKCEGQHSTMTDERQAALERLGFVWDSHGATWEERWNELREFKEQNGHTNVPKRYPQNHQLAVWVKCQRRQYKLLTQGKPSNMTNTRIRRLHLLGFVFDPRMKWKMENEGM